MTALSRGTLSALLLSLIVFGLGQTILFALLGPLARDIGLDVIQIGVVVTISALVVVVASPVWGRISDRWGRRATLALGLAGYAATTLLFVFVLHLGLTGATVPLTTFVLMVASRILYALVAAAIQPSAAALVADGTSLDQRASGMALVGAGFMLGTILGPLLGAVLVGWGLLTPLLVTTGLALAAAVAAFLLVDAPSPGIREATAKLKPTDPRLAAILCLAAIAFITIAITQQTLSFYVQDLLNLDTVETTRRVGAALAGFAIAALLTQASLVRRFSLSPPVLLRTGSLLLSVGFVALTFANGLTVVVAACVLLGVGYGLVMPGFQTAASLAVDPTEQGAAAGLISAAMALGFVAGPILGTSLYKIAPPIPYAASAALCLGLFVSTFLLGAVSMPRKASCAD
ncbi:MAG: MFS transporter [Rhodospirillales bacterium]|nr:MFS transporter [Rhodospirillales bacterium]